MMRFCARAILTPSALRMLVIQAGIQFASFQQRVSLTICQPLRGSHLPSQTKCMVGMADSCSFIFAPTDDGMRDCKLARQSRGELLSSFCSTLRRQEPVLPIASLMPIICFRPLKSGQMRHQSPNMNREGYYLIKRPSTSRARSSVFEQGH